MTSDAHFDIVQLFAEYDAPISSLRMDVAREDPSRA